jgi:hypothetical protein
MPAFRLGSSLLAAISGIALAALAQPGAGHAYTPEQEQACTPDAMRLCSEFIPNVDAITACMVQKKAQLSPQCRVFFGQGPESTEASSLRAGKPMSIKPTKTTTAKPAATKKTTASKKKKKPDET